MPGRKVYIAVDFDGTIVEHRFPDVGPPVPQALEWLKKFKEAGATLILWTMRSDNQVEGSVLTEAVDYCESVGVEFDLLNENPQPWTTSNKAYAHYYIDDAAAGAPLIFPEDGRRPYFDWDAVGAEILRFIKERLPDGGT